MSPIRAAVPPEVRALSSSGRTVTVRGNRAVIAHVGAWLTARPDPVPHDLDVVLPDLEAAMLRLLDDDDDDEEEAS